MLSRIRFIEQLNRAPWIATRCIPWDPGHRKAGCTSPAIFEQGPGRGPGSDSVGTHVRPRQGQPSLQHFIAPSPPLPSWLSMPPSVPDHDAGLHVLRGGGWVGKMRHGVAGAGPAQPAQHPGAWIVPPMTYCTSSVASLFFSLMYLARRVPAGNPVGLGTGPARTRATSCQAHLWGSPSPPTHGTARDRARPAAHHCETNVASASSTSPIPECLCPGSRPQPDRR